MDETLTRRGGASGRRRKDHVGCTRRRRLRLVKALESHLKTGSGLGRGAEIAGGDLPDFGEGSRRARRR